MILKAAHIPPRKLPRPTSLAARRGLAYQKLFTRAFELSAPANIGTLPEPWFAYHDTSAEHPNAICSPDLVAIDAENGFAIVLEVKTTYTPLALEKLLAIYCPVVARYTGLPAKPIVVCKTLTPGCPRPQSTISFALLSAEPLFHWTGLGPILW